MFYRDSLEAYVRLGAQVSSSNPQSQLITLHSHCDARNPKP